MIDLDRRQFFKRVFAKVAQAAGAVVVASATVPLAKAHGQPSEDAEPPRDVQERADRLAANAPADQAEGETQLCEFLNGAFRNTPWGGFGNTPIGSFRNTPIGSFRNAPLSGFRNTPFGPFGNGGWQNFFPGGFRNGGWPNSGWHNWW
jgi:hypothetical protein